MFWDAPAGSRNCGYAAPRTVFVRVVPRATMGFSLDIEGRLQRRWPFGARLYTAFQRVDIGFMANSVAFQAFSAMLPLIVVLFIIVAVVAGETLANQVLALTESFLPEQGRRLLANAVTNQLQTTSASVVSVAILLWGGLNLFKGLDTAFSEIYQTKAANSLVEQTKDALVVFGVLLLAIVAAIAATSIPFLARIPFIGLVAPLVLLVGLVAVFLPMYIEFPDTEVTWRQALPGAILAAIGWTVLQLLFGFYVSVTSSGEGSGVIGAVLLLLTWLYIGSFLLLLGALVNAVIADVRPKPRMSAGAVPAPE